MGAAGAKSETAGADLGIAGSVLEDGETGHVIEEGVMTAVAGTALGITVGTGLASVRRGTTQITGVMAEIAVGIGLGTLGTATVIQGEDWAGRHVRFVVKTFQKPRSLKRSRVTLWLMLLLLKRKKHIGGALKSK
jgi:hypothetical protein